MLGYFLCVCASEEARARERGLPAREGTCFVRTKCVRLQGALRSLERSSSRLCVWNKERRPDARPVEFALLDFQVWRKDSLGKKRRLAGVWCLG